MGLIYSGSESAELIQALTANLQSGKEATSQLKAGSQKVVSAVDGKTLSGAAYTAGKGLFSDLILPTIAKVTTAMDNVETELATYRSANEHVVGEGLLDEDKLTQQISTKQAMKASVDASASIARALSRSNPVAKILDALLNVESSLNRMAGDLNDDIRELHQKLEKLHTFSSQTNGLFSNSLNDMKIAMQGVLVLNNTIVHSDGTYHLPSGVDKSWFTEIKKNKQGEFDELKKKLNAGDLPTTKAEILRDYHWSTNSNMYVNNKTGLPSPEVTALYNKLVMAEHQPQENPQLAFFNEMLSTGRHPITGEAISKADRLNAQIMIYALALQPFVGAWAMAQVPKSYEPSSVKKTSDVNKKIVEDITNPVLEAPRSGSGLKVDEVKPIKGKGSIYDSDPLTGKTPAKQTQIIIEEFPNVPKAHGFSDIIDNYAGLAEVTDLGNAKLYQIQGSQNGVVGRFEWIIQDGKVTHRMFVRNPELNGVPIK